MREFPLFATQTGEHRYDDRLDAMAESDFERRAAQLRAFSDRQRAIDRGELAPGDQLHYDIFARLLDDEIAEIEFRAYRMPLARTGGFHTAFPDLPMFAPFDTAADY